MMSSEQKNGENKTTEKMEKLSLVKEEEEEEDKESGEGPHTPTIEEQFPPIIGNNYVRLISNDNHEYYIRRELAETSKTIRDMLNVPGTLHNTTVYLHMFGSRILGIICNFLLYRKHYLDKKGDVEQFVVPPEDAIEIFLASGFLNL